MQIAGVLQVAIWNSNSSPVLREAFRNTFVNLIAFLSF